MANKPVMICETLLRDAHQSLLATRMRTEDMLPLCSMLDDIGYWSLEVWGGATFDPAIRFPREDPWERFKTPQKGLRQNPLPKLPPRPNAGGGYSPALPAPAGARGGFGPVVNRLLA